MLVVIEGDRRARAANATRTMSIKQLSCVIAFVLASLSLVLLLPLLSLQCGVPTL
jgi:hypothetical protein